MTTAVPTQTGYQTAAGVWVDFATPLAGGGNIAAARWDLSAEDWATQLLTANPTLEIEFNTAPLINSVTIVEMFQQRFVNEAFTSSNLPAMQGVKPKVIATMLGDGVTDTYTTPLDAGELMSVMKAETWDGVLSLRLDNDTSAGTWTNAATATLTYLLDSHYTGLNAAPWTKQSRADQCSKCGGFVFREQLSTDGYTRILVCPECWDPPDTTNYSRRRRRPMREVNP